MYFPPWLQAIISKLPLWVQWAIPMVMNMVMTYVFPALEKAFPQYAQLLEDIKKWLLGQGMSGPLKAAVEHYHVAAAAYKAEQK